MITKVTKYPAYFLMGVLSYMLIEPLITYWDVKPFYDMEVRVVEWGEDGLTLAGTFNKNDKCQLITFSVLAFNNGVPRYVDYTDLDGLAYNFDREAGEQGINIFVPTPVDAVDYVELRARHKCIIDKDGNTEVKTRVISRHEAK